MILEILWIAFKHSCNFVVTRFMHISPAYFKCCGLGFAPCDEVAPPSVANEGYQGPVHQLVCMNTGRKHEELQLVHFSINLG